MKFSQTYASRYIASLEVRSAFANMHVSNFKKTLSSSLGMDIPAWMRKQYSELGVLQDVLDNPDPSKWNKELTDKILFEPKRVMVDVDNVKVYIIRKTVQEIVSKINIKEEKRFDYLKKATDGNRILVLDEHRFFKYYKSGSRIVVMYIYRLVDKVNYIMFNYDLDVEYASDAENADVKAAHCMFLQLMIFLEYAEYEEVYLKPNEKNGVRADGKVLNDTKQNLIIVDSNWNRIVIRTDGFKVGEASGGFLAFRACGAGRFDRHLVWIKPFDKKGYVRGIKKEKIHE